MIPSQEFPLHTTTDLHTDTVLETVNIQNVLSTAHTRTLMIIFVQNFTCLEPMIH